MEPKIDTDSVPVIQGDLEYDARVILYVIKGL